MQNDSRIVGNDRQLLERALSDICSLWNDLREMREKIDEAIKRIEIQDKHITALTRIVQRLERDSRKEAEE